MRIKRLKLAGFKSFVEPAELRIEPGLTGVVGPNGCGKSNVLEAIRWVMGESSPKSMRGAGMDDVIFAGSAARPARDFAEVSLLVERDGADGNETEVVRRIERGAGSAYRVNGKDVRAKDVALLFADAATGAHSPALVSQGRISAVIAAKPTERRQMLEEAAGIAGLHVRRKDAEQKLRAAEANLARLDEVLAEMEQRAAALRRQAKSAERYRRLSERVRTAEARLIFARWREAAAAAEAAAAEARAAEQKVIAATEAQRTAAAVRAEAETILTQRRQQAQALRDRSSSMAHRRATVEAEQAQVNRRISELAQRQETLIADRSRETMLSEDAAAALARLEAEMVAIERRLEEAASGSEQVETRLAAAMDAAETADAALATERAKQAGEQAEARVARSALEAAQRLLERAEAEERRASEALAELGAQDPLVAARKAARETREAAEADLDNARKSIGAAEESRREAAMARDAAESDAAAARAALSAIEAEAKALLQAVESGGRERALAHVRARPGYERALAAALGDDLEAAIGGDSPRRWAGAALDGSEPPLPQGTMALAAHVEAPPELARRLAQVAVADRDSGIALAVGQRLVTRDGRLRRWDGFVTAGAGAAAAERLIRLNRLAEIEQSLPQAAEALRAAEALATAALQKLEAARQAGDEARKAENEAAERIREGAREEDAANVAIERLDFRRSGLAERTAQAQREVKEAQQLAREAGAAVAVLPAAAATEAKVASRKAEAEGAHRALAEARAQAATHDRQMSADRHRLEAAREEGEDWRARAAKADQRAIELVERIAAAQAEAAELAPAPKQLAVELETLRAELTAAEAALAEAATAERAAEAALRSADSGLSQAGEAIASAREARAGAAARHENQEARRVEMARIAGERFECPPPLLPQRAGFEEGLLEPSAAESATLERLTAERERIGPVNLVAESELAEIETSHAASHAEREELGLAINRLRGSIGSLNREGRARLLQAFQTVDRHFRSLFTTLFEGGQAHLELVESDDPLEAGLEIMAQPPGKRLATLTLLSGGEQALTAIALIFALFLTNPAPICVLDEVDAPLDDANIERFCDLLDRMTDETDTRYLIVTHNAVTMSRMHRLFGVTMIEKGVSRLVSVDLGGAESLLAAE